MQKRYLDANVLLEILFQRARSKKVISLLESMHDIQFCISVLTVDLVMYFVEAEKKPKENARKFLKRYEVLDMTAKDVQWAHDNDAGDFEDALQTSCARRHGCTAIITLDQKVERMYGKYIPIQTVK